MIPAFWYLGRGEMLGAKRAPNEGTLGNTHRVKRYSQKIQSEDTVKRYSQRIQSKDTVRGWSGRGWFIKIPPIKKSDRCG
jgi:hypothetical protein